MGIAEIRALKLGKGKKLYEEDDPVEVAPTGPKPKQPLKQVSDKKKIKDAEAKAQPPTGVKKTWYQMPKRTEKMKGIMAAIKPLYKNFLKEKPYCEIRSPVCTSEATAVHHTAGRGMNHLMDTNTWEACCSACNTYVEEHDGWAKANGHKYSKHKKS